MFIIFGSKRVPNISIPLRVAGAEVIEVPCFGNIFQRLRGIWSFLRTCVRHPKAVIITDTPHWTGLVVMVLTAILRREYFLRLRGLILKEHTSPLMQSMNRKILRRARAVIFISRFMQESMAEDLPHLQAFTTIPVPHMDLNKARLTERVPPGHREGCILTVTGFHFQQKIQPLLEVFPVMDRLLSRHPYVRWVICGGGPLLDQVRRRQAQCRNGERIIVKGHCPDIVSEYLKASVFLYFTGLDSFGCVINEAFLFGLPVIANTEASMPEMVRDRIDGWLIDISSGSWEEELYRILDEAIEHPETAKARGEAGRRKVFDTLSPQRIGALYRKFFAELGVETLSHDRHQVRQAGLYP